MRVIHVLASVAPQYGGPSASVFPMARAVRDLGHDVEILTTDRGGVDPGTRLGFRLERDGVPITYFPTSFPRPYGTSYALARALHAQIATADVVHIHSLYLFHTVVAARLCLRLGVPYVIRPHGTLNPYHRRRHRRAKAAYDRLLQQRILDGAAALHLTSDAEAEGLADLRLKPSTAIIALGTPLSDPVADLGDSRLGLPDDARLVTFLGRLSRKKNVGMLTEAFATIAARHPDTLLVLAGPDTEGLGQEALSIAAAWGHADRLVLPGLVGGSDKAWLLRRSSVFVLPSEDENFGVAVLEALEAGVPVLVSDGVALSKEISEADAGLVIDRNASAIARGMTRLLDDFDGARRLGENGRRLVHSRFSWPQIGRDLERLYRQMKETRG